MAQRPGSADWLRPQWDAPAQVRALCTTRAGGVSPAPYASMNLGSHVGDWGYNVMANRNALRAVLQARPVFLNQVHGVQVAHLDDDPADGQAADASLSTRPGVACTVLVADCLPVLLARADGRAVAAAHAGWRGLAGGVVEAAVTALQRAGPAGDIHAWLGPCIGPRAFEVGPEVRDAFVAHQPQAAQAFRPGREDRLLADLGALARQRLAAAGVTRVSGNDGSDAWCTVANASRFFSFRRDGATGRMAACIWLAA